MGFLFLFFCVVWFCFVFCWFVGVFVGFFGFVLVCWGLGWLMVCLLVYGYVVVGFWKGI